MNWLDDPQLARRLSRFTWAVLVVAFVVIAPGGLEPRVQRGALAALLIAVGFLNAPVALGLWRSRAERDTPAFRAVALTFVVRVATALWMIWALTP